MSFSSSGGDSNQDNTNNSVTQHAQLHSATQESLEPTIESEEDGVELVFQTNTTLSEGDDAVEVQFLLDTLAQSSSVEDDESSESSVSLRDWTRRLILRRLTTSRSI